MGLQGHSTGDKGKAGIEYAMLEPGLLLVDGYRVSFGVGSKIGEEVPEAQKGGAYFITFEGRVNNTQERQEVHIMMHAELGFEMSGEMLDRLEQVIKIAKGQDPTSPPLPPAFGGTPT